MACIRVWHWYPPPPDWWRIMAAQHFSSSFLLDFHPAGKNRVQPIRWSSYLKTTRRPATRASLSERRSGEVMFCVPFSGLREEKALAEIKQVRLWEPGSSVFRLRSSDRKKKKRRRRNAWQLWLMKLERGGSKSPSTWRRHGYNNPQ